MKEKTKLSGIITAMMLVMFLMVGCDLSKLISSDDSSDNGSGNSNGDTVTISGTAKLMMKITAKSGGNFSGNYDWFYANSADSYFWSTLANGDTLNVASGYIGGTSRSEFTIPVEDTYGTSLVGQYIRARRHDHNTNIDVWSNTIGPVLLADNGTIVINGIAKLGLTLDAASDPNFAGNYDWYYAPSLSSSSWSELYGSVPNSNISGTNRRDFTIPSTDLSGTSLVGMYIKVRRLHDNVDFIWSNTLGPVQPDDGGTVTISGTPKVGMKFTATSDTNFSGNYDWFYAYSADSFGWSTLANGNTLNVASGYIGGVSRSELTIPPTDSYGTSLVGQYIRARRHNYMNGNDIWSNTIGPIQPQ